MTTALRLLMVEDSPDDAELIRLELKRSGFDVKWRRVEREPDFVDALGEAWDVIISDFHMPHFDGLRAFTAYRARQLDTPFIFVSGTLGEERAVEAMRAGAADYLLKGKLARLGVAVRRELASVADRRAKREAEAAARKEQRRLAMAVEASGAGVFEYRLPYGTDLYHNERYAEILGYDLDELPQPECFLEWYFDQMHPDDLDVVRAAYDEFTGGRTERLDIHMRMRRAGGEWTPVHASAKALERDESGRTTHVVGVLLDLSDRRRLEAQLRQAQKMEAIGRLAGGVAHDFNNLLTVIFTSGRFVLDALEADDAAAATEDMAEVLKAARRASALTEQLLAFSRSKPVAPKVVNINATVGEMDRMLRRIMGEDVDVATTLEPGLWNVHVDPGSLEQVIANLAVNARDAMPFGGHLTIETYNAKVDDSFGAMRGVEVPPGDYVVVVVSDDGVGMDEETRRKVFEPFFTTKGPSKGTGLGLATCYGIVKQAGGFIWVYSEMGHGTSFKVYLPRVAGDAEDRPVEVQEAPTQTRGSETILIVEDDDGLRRLIRRSLVKLGYDVLETGAGEEALRLCQESTAGIDLLLTDVIMPEMHGTELVEKVRPLQPHMKIVYMSGYTPDLMVQRKVIRPDAHALQKPFTPDELGRRIREVLDGPVKEGATP